MVTGIYVEVCEMNCTRYFAHGQPFIFYFFHVGFFQECLNVFLSACFCDCIDYAANVSYQFGPSVLLFFFLFCIDIDIFLAVNSLIALIRPYGSDDVCLEMPSLRS